MALLDQLGDYAATARIADLPSPGRDRVAVHWRDALGALAAGCLLDDARALAALIDAQDGPALRHAAAFAGAMRMTEIDDIDRVSGVTAAAVAAPVALGLLGAAGKDAAARALDAFAVGYETAVRLGEAAGGAPLLARGVWPTYLVAPAGAAATAARLLGLDGQATAQALAIALARAAPGVGRPPGPRPARWFAYTQAVRDGCAAALAARDGITGDTALLEGGWIASRTGLASEQAAAALTQGLRSDHAIGRASIKPFCSAKQGLAAIEAFRQILAGGIDVAAIDAVTVRVPAAYAAMIGHPGFPTARIPSLVGARYQLAVAALAPGVLHDIRRDPLLRNAGLEALAERIDVVADDALAAGYPAAWPAEVTVRAAGATRTVRVSDSPGDPAQPFDAAAVGEKYRAVLGQLVPAADAEKWLGMIDDAAADPAQFAPLAEALAAALRR